MDNTKRALAEEATEKKYPGPLTKEVLPLMWMHRWKAWKRAGRCQMAPTVKCTSYQKGSDRAAWRH